MAESNFNKNDSKFKKSQENNASPSRFSDVIDQFEATNDQIRETGLPHKQSRQ